MKLKFYLLILSALFFVSCKSTAKMLTREYMHNSPRCLEYYRAPSMADPGGMHVWLNQKGEILIIVNGKGSRDEYSMRLMKPEKKEIWRQIDSISDSQWNDKYEIGLDSKVYQIHLRSNGDEEFYTRYSAGAPQNIREVINFLEVKAKEQID